MRTRRSLKPNHHRQKPIITQNNNYARAWVLDLTSQLSRPRPRQRGRGPKSSRIQQGLENRGFNQIKKFLRRITLGVIKICLSEKKNWGLGAL